MSNLADPGMHTTKRNETKLENLPGNIQISDIFLGFFELSFNEFKSMACTLYDFNFLTSNSLREFNCQVISYSSSSPVKDTWVNQGLSVLKIFQKSLEEVLSSGQTDSDSLVNLEILVPENYYQAISVGENICSFFGLKSNDEIFNALERPDALK